MCNTCKSTVPANNSVLNAGALPVILQRGIKGGYIVRYGFSSELREGMRSDLIFAGNAADTLAFLTDEMSKADTPIDSAEAVRGAA